MCLAAEAAVNLGQWARDVYRYHEDVKKCGGVKETVGFGKLVNNWQDKATEAIAQESK